MAFWGIEFCRRSLVCLEEGIGAYLACGAKCYISWYISGPRKRGRLASHAVQPRGQNETPRHVLQLDPPNRGPQKGKPWSHTRLDTKYSWPIAHGQVLASLGFLFSLSARTLAKQLRSPRPYMKACSVSCWAQKPLTEVLRECTHMRPHGLAAHWQIDRNRFRMAAVVY
jgi:hypothetical protein